MALSTYGRATDTACVCQAACEHHVMSPSSLSSGLSMRERRRVCTACHGVRGVRSFPLPAPKSADP